MVPITISNGQLAIIFAGITATLIPIVNLILQRLGISTTRRTELDKMALDRLKTVEADLQKCREEHISKDGSIDDYRTTIQTLREGHIDDLLIHNKLVECEDDKTKLLEQLKDYQKKG